MLVAGKWYDPVIGIDIHIIQPPGPVPPVPVPHPFIGIVFDPIGLAVGMAIGAAISGIFGGPFKGPVMINGMPAANTGTEVKGMPVHIPIGGTFVNPPSNEGTIITGSKTVNVMGSSAARLTSMVITCNDPVNLPTSLVMAIPMGAPVLIGGPVGLDIIAALLAGIRCKWVSDKLHGLLKAKPGSWRSKIICFFTGHPVDVATGRVTTDHVDFALPGPIPFQFARNYYSASTYNGPLGHGWHHSYDQHIAIRAEGIFLRFEDGREIEFDYLEEGETTYEPVERLTLHRNKEGWILKTADGRILRFSPLERSDGTHPLLRIEDLNGHTIQLKYVGDHLVTIVDSAGRALELVNDRNGRLLFLQTPHPAGGTQTVTVARFTYDAAGDLITVGDAYGHAYRYAYTNHLLVRETNRNGLSFYFGYDEYTADGSCVHTWGDGGIYDHKLTYFKPAHISVVEDSLNARTTYLCNSAGLVTGIVDALGGKTMFAWDDCCRRTSETDACGNAIRWKYDSHGNAVAFTDQLGFVTRQKFSSLNAPVAVIDPEGNQWEWEYDQGGNATVTLDPLGHRWRYEYDSRGNLLHLTDPCGGVTRFLCNERCEVIACTMPGGATTWYTYDDWGRLTTLTLPGGGIVRYEYDLMSRLVSVQKPNQSTRRFSYDPDGNVLKFVDGNGNETSFRYAGCNKLIERVDAAGSMQRFAYDTEENLIQVRNECDETHLIERDILGRVTRETTFHGGTTTYKYGPTGLVLEELDSAGRGSRVEYDPAGQVVKQECGDGQVFRFEYDSMGRVTRSQAAHCDIRLKYDPCGLVVSEIQNGREVQHEYGAGGRVSSRRSPMGTVIRYDYDADGHLKRMETPGGTIRFDYGASGRVLRRSYPGGLEEVRSYDATGQLREQVVRRSNHLLFRRDYTYDHEGNLTGLGDTAKGRTSFFYDRLNRLHEVTRPGQTSEVYGFDAAGNMLSGSNKDFSHGPGGCVMRSPTGSYHYDPMGHLVQKSMGGVVTKYSYDANSRLALIESDRGMRAEFRYDAIGRRIGKSGNADATQFLWDGENLLSEGSGNEWIEYLFEPESFKPLARLNNGAFETFLTDHLGTPSEVADDEGRIIWSAYYDCYGRIVALPAQKLRNNLRFPGHYEDTETSLYYNRFRYYDPELGRYTTPDPIGPYGGLNLYRYTPNPLSYVDPFGLASCKIGKGGLEIGWGGKWRIRLFHKAPNSGRFDVFVIRGIIRFEIHPISQKLPQWLYLPHIHLDFLPGQWGHMHIPWEIYPGSLNDFLRKLGL